MKDNANKSVWYYYSLSRPEEIKQNQVFFGGAQNYGGTGCRESNQPTNRLMPVPRRDGCHALICLLPVGEVAIRVHTVFGPASHRSVQRKDPPQRSRSGGILF